MLDLNTVLDEKYYDIKLLDGKILHLDRPSQAMIENTLVVDKVADSGNTEGTVKALAILFMRILNRNNEGIKFEYNELTEVYSFEVMGYVIEDYFNFWNLDSNNKVNFQKDQQA